MNKVGAKTYNWSNDRFTGYTEDTFASGRESYSYSYNGKGQRIQKKYMYFPGPQTLDEYITSQTDKYVYDTAGRLINLHRQTNWNQATLNTTEKLVFFYDALGVAGFVYKKGTTTKYYYYLKSPMGDIIGIKDESGTLVGSYSYDAFGVCTKSGSTAILSLNPFRYRGYFYDEETGCYYLQSRYYNAEWHRFLSPDHPSYIDTEQANCLDLYAYCANDPVNYVDPSGHLAEWIQWLKGIGQIITGALAVALGAIVFAGGAPIGMLLIAGATAVAGALTLNNGVADTIGNATGYNYMRDGLFKGISTAYNWYSFSTETLATIGMAFCGSYINTTYFMDGDIFGTSKWVHLEKGTYLDRYGSEFGRYLTLPGTSASDLALPTTNSLVLHHYLLTKNIYMSSSLVANGNAVQYFSWRSIHMLIKLGYIVEI